MIFTSQFSGTQRKHLKRRTLSGELTVLAPGVLIDTQGWDAAPPSIKFHIQALALTRQYPRCVLSGRGAAMMHKIPINDYSPTFELLFTCSRTPRRNLTIKRASPLILDRCCSLTQSFDFCPEPVTVNVTSIVDTLASLATEGNISQIVMAMDHCLHNNMISYAELQQLSQDYKGTKAVATLRKAIALAHHGCESPRESEVRIELIKMNIGPFEIQTKIFIHENQQTIRVDFFIRSHMIVIEYDGEGKYAADPTGSALNDLSRMHRAHTAGFRFIRIDKRAWKTGSWKQILLDLLDGPEVEAPRGVDISGGWVIDPSTLPNI